MRNKTNKNDDVYIYDVQLYTVHILSCLNIGKEEEYAHCAGEDGLQGRCERERLGQDHSGGLGAGQNLSAENFDHSYFQEVAPQGSQLVPDDVKKELLREIRTFLDQQAED